MKHMKANSFYTKAGKKTNNFMSQLAAWGKGAIHWLMSDPPSTYENEAEGRRDLRTAAVSFMFVLGMSMVQLISMGFGAIGTFGIPTVQTSVPQIDLALSG